MFKYRFVCRDRDNALFRINNMMMNDAPYTKTWFGGNPYKSGIHFRSVSKNVAGFYLNNYDDDIFMSDQIRVWFFGKFVEENQGLFFDAYIFHRITDIILLLAVFSAFVFWGDVIGLLISIFFAYIFGKRYYNMIKKIKEILSDIMS